jgi:phage baseplate assembly protein W
MQGMDRNTGKPLAGMAHLRQSIQDILTTTIGERLICRDYGAKVFNYIDQPLNDSLTLEIMAAVANALHDFEPRIQLTKAGVHNMDGSHLTLQLEGSYENQAFTELVTISHRLKKG